jgi:PTS system nitrogen regulatory IIA component
MPLDDLITADAILPALRVNTKKSALHEMSERAGAVSGLNPREIYDAVLQRERLGSTGVGNGIAIPHGKLLSCTKIVGVFARLERPIEFESLDGEPVDLAFLLVAPEASGADHLKALARIARVLREPRTVAQLRATRDAAGLYGVLAQHQASNAA